MLPSGCQFDILWGSIDWKSVLTLVLSSLSCISLVSIGCRTSCIFDWSVNRIDSCNFELCSQGFFLNNFLFYVIQGWAGQLMNNKQISVGSYIVANCLNEVEFETYCSVVVTRNEVSVHSKIWSEIYWSQPPHSVESCHSWISVYFMSFFHSLQKAKAKIFVWKALKAVCSLHPCGQHLSIQFKCTIFTRIQGGVVKWRINQFLV